MVGMFGEKAETKEMKNKLAEYFKNRDLDGAREYFLREREKRPDVLMEASDITGELRISMQIIATALKEREWEKDTILDRENEYGKLIKLSSELNSNISLWMANHKLEDESSKEEEKKPAKKTTTKAKESAADGKAKKPAAKKTTAKKEEAKA